MPPPDPFQGLKPSVLDRLTDADSAGTAGRRGYGVRQMEEAVRRDLEDLLNTRRPPDRDADGQPYFGGLEEVPRSIANYGLRDLARPDALNDALRAELARHIEEVITAFEPRLRDVRVRVRNTDEVKQARKNDFKQTALYFHIEGRLDLDPAPAVAFETVLELTKGHHQVLKDDA
jgi:type VI secretion system protein ImpF